MSIAAIHQVMWSLFFFFSRLQLKHVKMTMNKSEVVASTTTLVAPECYGSSLFNHTANRDYLSSLTNEQVYAYIH